MTNIHNRVAVPVTIGALIQFAGIEFFGLDAAYWTCAVALAALVWIAWRTYWIN